MGPCLSGLARQTSKAQCDNSRHDCLLVLPLMKVIDLLVISDEQIRRLGLSHLLASEAGFQVSGKGGNEEAAQLASKLKPDVVIVLAEGARPGCVELISSIRKAAPRSGIVILGRETHHAYLGLLLAAGVLGYVLLQTSPRELFNAIRTVSRGRRLSIVSCRRRIVRVTCPAGRVRHQSTQPARTASVENACLRTHFGRDRRSFEHKPKID